MSQPRNLTNCTFAALFLLYDVISIINSNNNNDNSPSSVGTLEGTNGLLMISHNLVGKCEHRKCHVDITESEESHLTITAAAKQYSYVIPPSASFCRFSSYRVTFKRSACSDAPSLPTALPLRTNSWLLTFHLSPMEWPWRRTTLFAFVLQKWCTHFNQPFLSSLCVLSSSVCAN